jgi:ArsR family transcriptional regulator
MNVITKSPEKIIAEYLKVLGSPIRIRILFSIGHGEACVCHLEALLNKRQAYISQHLMALRDAGNLETRRDGKYIFYRIADKSLFDLFYSAADILGIDEKDLPDPSIKADLSNCECPICHPGV